MKTSSDGVVQLSTAIAGDSGMLIEIINNAVDAIVVIDEEGKISFVNRATERMFGYSREEMLGQPVNMLMPEPMRSEHGTYLKNYLATGIKKIIGIGRQITPRRKDGSIFPADLAVSDTRIGERRFFTGVLRDMSERVRVQEELSEERDFVRNLIETAHAIILLLDPEGRIVLFNPYMESVAGYELEEVRAHDYFTTFLPLRDRLRIREVFERTLQGTPVNNYVNTIVTKSGIERIISWSGRRTTDRHGNVTGVLGIGNDITDLKEAERKLLQSERLAAIGQMVTGLAHESRNALQRTRACLEMLELDLEERPDMLNLIRRAHHAMDEIHNLYEEVREYAAPMKLERRECDIAEIWNEAWENLQSHRTEKNVQFRAECAGVNTWMRVDRPRMLQVFRNILENAIAACSERGENSIHCSDLTWHGRPAVRLVFRDDGPGLNAEQASRIFEPFYTTKTRGTGLGMPIARRIVESHGGTIGIGNSGEPGAEIIVILPR